MKLFEPTFHVPVSLEAWSSERALQAANSIFDFLVNGLEPDGFWRAHPEEESDWDFDKCIYNGAAGTLWALLELSRRLKRSLPFDPSRLVSRILQSYLDQPDSKIYERSVMVGESGILALSEKISSTLEIRSKLIANIEKNISNPVNEALYGGPGTMLVALRLGETELFLRNAEYLLGQWFLKSEKGFWIWTQNLGGKNSEYLGAGHGFFGNIHALLAGFHLLSDFQKELVLQRTVSTGLGSALRESGFANWHALLGSYPDRVPYVQWCHGAPGVITSLRNFPKSYSSELEVLLLEAGELIWTAGPLDTIGICHGTDGNGYALLQLFERTGNPIWLERARAFGMTALKQRNGRYSLWTGEAGLALFLLACVDERAGMPSLDYF